MDVINFFEQVIFCFLTGNADAHLKNFSLIDLPDGGLTIAPAYDMVATALITPDDTEQLALTRNSRKKKLKLVDFEAAFNPMKLNAVTQRNIFSRFAQAIPAWLSFIDRSFVSGERKDALKKLILDRAALIDILD